MIDLARNSEVACSRSFDLIEEARAYIQKLFIHCMRLALNRLLHVWMWKKPIQIKGEKGWLAGLSSERDIVTDS